MASKYYLIILLLSVLGQNIKAKDSLDIETGRFNTDTTNKLQADFSVGNGYEYNTLKSTSRYFERASEMYLPVDSLITSGMFLFGETDLSYTINYKKSYANFDVRGWYRNYYENTSLNQAKIKGRGEYGYFITKKILLGLQYSAGYSDVIAISTAGDELASKYKYVDNQGSVFAEIKYDKQNTISLEANINSKSYLSELTSYSLSNMEYGLQCKYKKRIAKKHVLYVFLSASQRDYSSYLALDATGASDTASPLRVYRYFDVGAKYRYKLSSNFVVYPSAGFAKRVDTYQGYYTFTDIGVGLDAKASFKKITLFAGFDLKQRTYDNKLAPAFTPADNLQYLYLKTKYKAEYEAGKSFLIFIKAETDSRNSNNMLEYYRTLRSYNQFEITAGITYSLK